MEDGKIYSGEEFNKFGLKCVKILRNDLTHFGYKYTLGLNKDHNELIIGDGREKGGLYFTAAQFYWYYIPYGELIGFIKIPNDALVFVEDEDYYRFKADKFILEKTIPLKDFRLSDWFEKDIVDEYLELISH